MVGISSSAYSNWNSATTKKQLQTQNEKHVKRTNFCNAKCPVAVLAQVMHGFGSFGRSENVIHTNESHVRRHVITFQLSFESFLQVSDV